MVRYLPHLLYYAAGVSKSRKMVTIDQSPDSVVPMLEIFAERNPKKQTSQVQIRHAGSWVQLLHVIALISGARTQLKRNRLNLLPGFAHLIYIS